MSKYCPLCISAKNELGETTDEYNVWYSDHKNSRQINHVGTSGAMKIKAVAKIWSLSEKCGFRYTTLLSDGDAKTHKFLNSLKIYGPDVEVLKEECINHVSKRLCTSLRNLVKDWRAKGITLGGKSMSTDKNPMHMKCPPGKDSWCFYRRALAKGCARCLTQNSNESLHSVTWSKCCKETSAKSRRVNIAVSEAVSEYNFGTLKALKEIQKAANLDLGEEAVKIAATRDYRRKKERNRQKDLSKFKKKRTVVYSSLTKFINKIEGKINNENEPVDQFEAFLDQLNDKESNLSLLNILIEDRLSVDTITEDMEASEEIKEKVIFWKMKLSSKIRRINSDSIQVDTVSRNIQVIDSNSFEYSAVPPSGGRKGKQKREHCKIESDRITHSDSDRGEHRFRRTLSRRLWVRS
ncbi:uncharacterized protein TNCV_4548241 [Trichonephila clavipes]|nr:uncharacterized protein TNCV_4548241 [Trichonephila clavipes]